MVAGRKWAAAGCAGMMLLVAGRGAAGEPEVDPLAVAQRFADRLVAGKYEEAVKDFDERVAAAMSADLLKQTWEKLAAQCGKFERFGPPRKVKTGDMVSVFMPGKWKSFSLDMQVVVDSKGKISGLWFKPAQTTEEYQAPNYVRKSKFSERDVKVGIAPWLLDGKLSVPKDASKKMPGVVLVHGSGPNDMDETIGMNRPFRDLAWGLASRGIVVLRYNKRTNAYGAVMKAKDVNVRFEVIDDALAALKLLREQPEVDPKRTYIIGHSLGACLAPSIGAEDPKLAGMVLLSGTLRPMEEVIVDQLSYIASLPGEGQDQATKALADARKAIDEYKAGTSAADAKLLGAPISYWHDLSSYLGVTGQERARKFDRPMLIMGGGRDYQISRKDFELWQKTLKGRSNVTFEWIEDVNHLYAAGEGKATPNEYMSGQKHVEKDVIVGIAGWIKTGKYGEAK